MYSMFRFTIRDVLWLTVVVAICCTWFIHNKRWSLRFAASEQKAKVNWHLFQVQTQEVKNAMEEGRQAQVAESAGYFEALRESAIRQVEGQEPAAKEAAIREFQSRIIQAATNMLGRALSEPERQFIVSRNGLRALAAIHDSVTDQTKEELQQYLNSEAR